jgi:hypothetical protein
MNINNIPNGAYYIFTNGFGGYVVGQKGVFSTTYADFGTAVEEYKNLTQ